MEGGVALIICCKKNFLKVLLEVLDVHLRREEYDGLALH
jgi:hypothetical protein